jgi:hypothetical protein
VKVTKAQHTAASKPLAHASSVAGRPTTRPASPSPAPGHQVVQAQVTVPPSASPSVTPDQDAPRIISASITPKQIHSGDNVVGTVVTSANVDQVVASLDGVSQALTKVAAGHFTYAYQVPLLPAWIHGVYTIQVVATTASGASTQQEVSIEVP